MAMDPPISCTNLAKLPNDMLDVIFAKCLDESDSPFYTLSASCKEFYDLLHEPHMIRILNFDCTPESIFAVTEHSCPLLKRAYEAGNQLAGYLLGLHLTFNGPDSESEAGIEYLTGMENGQMWISRYIHSMALLKVGFVHKAGHSIQRLFQDMGYSRTAMRNCRDLFRQILHPGKHMSLGTTNFCVFSGYGHWQFKTDDEITGLREFHFRCLFCAIDIETYKLKHAIE